MQKMAFLSGLLNTIGDVISHVFNIYGSYKQITDGSDSRQNHYEHHRQNHYEHHEYHHYDGRNTEKELAAIKEMIKNKLIPDITDTTEVVRNVMKEFAESGQKLTEQIQTQLIPDAKTTIKTIEEILPAVNETLIVAKDAFSEVSNTSHILGVEISHAANQLHIGFEIGLMFLLLIVAAFCRYELRMMELLPEQNIFHRIEKMAICLLRYICISYGIMRLIIIVLLKQVEPSTRDVLLLTFLPVSICLLYDVVKQSNLQVTKSGRRMIYCGCQVFLWHMGNYAGSCVNFITEICSYFIAFQRWFAQKLRCIKNYMQKILRRIGDDLVTAINVESVPVLIWKPQKCVFPMFKLRK